MSARSHRAADVVWSFAFWAGAALLLAFLVAPLLGLVLTSFPAGVAGLSNPVVWPALRLSLVTTLVTLAIVLVTGIPLAWRISRSASRAAKWAEAFVQLPVVVPPAVAGVAMLLVYGRNGLLGGALELFGVRLPFTTAAVVMAEVFVSAPFFLQAAIAAFRALDENLLVVSRTLGAGPARTFFRVALPLALPGLLGGAAMSWARALGEFGATLMFAGNAQGVTQTLPLAVYAVMEVDLRAAQGISLLMVAIAFALLVALRFLLPRALPPSAPARRS